MSKRKYNKDPRVVSTINSKVPLNRSDIFKFELPKSDSSSRPRKPFDPTANDVRPSTNGPGGKGFGGVNLSDIYELYHLNRSNGSGNGDLDYMHLGEANNQIGSGNFLDYIYALLHGELGFSMSAETKRMILQQLMQYGFTNDQRKYDQSLLQDQRAYDQDVLREQRAYDWSLTENQRSYDRQLLQDQRLYDSPTNQLARLMGAGISRDAALQMLSGGSAGVGSSGGSPVVGSGVSPSSITSGGIPSGSGVPGGNSSIQTAQTVIQGIQAVGNLVAQGFDMYSAVQQARAMSMQNYMSKQQLDAFNSVNQVTSYLQDGVTQGILTPNDLNSWKNANDVYTWLNDHADTDFVKPLMSSGAFRSTFGSTLGRELFNNHWKQMQESKSAGEIYDSFVRQQEASARLAEFNVEKSYFDVQYAIGELSKQDVEIQNLWNSVWSGNIDIQIKGEQLKREKFDTNQASTRNDIFNAVFNGSNDGDLPDLRGLGRGARYIAFSQFDELSRMFHKAYALSGTKERQEEWEKFYRDNADAAMLMAGIQLHMTSKQSEYVSPEKSPILSSLIQLYQIGQLTGAFDVLKTSGQVAAEAALIFK